MLRTTLLPATALVLLAGCVSQAELANQHQRAIASYAEQHAEQFAAKWDRIHQSLYEDAIARCNKYQPDKGYKTPAGYMPSKAECVKATKLPEKTSQADIDDFSNATAQAINRGEQEGAQHAAEVNADCTAQSRSLLFTSSSHYANGYYRGCMAATPY
jgi:hypothetical protein